MGGLATAAALLRAGVDVTVYEQARTFARLGAGIQVGCNAMQVLRGLGLEQRIRSAAFYPRSWNNRDWRTGEVRYDQIFGPAAEAKYGAPYLLAHRGDLHATLASAVPAERIRLDHKLTGLEDRAGSVVLGFADGSTAGVLGEGERRHCRPAGSGGRGARWRAGHQCDRGGFRIDGEVRADLSLGRLQLG